MTIRPGMRVSVRETETDTRLGEVMEEHCCIEPGCWEVMPDGAEHPVHLLAEHLSLLLSPDDLAAQPDRAYQWLGSKGWHTTRGDHRGGSNPKVIAANPDHPRRWADPDPAPDQTAAPVPEETTPEADAHIHKCRCGYIYPGPPAAGDLTPGDRPELPEGVEPVAWSERERAWVVQFGYVPRTGWEVTWGYCGAWAAADGNRRGHLNDSDLVLARPVEPPSPATEEVPWHDAYGRVLPDGRAIKFVTLNAGYPNGAYSAGQGYVECPDGTVEVLCESEAGA